jgi:hypothetical protein
MAEGRTVWWCKDAGWWRREWIVDLGLEFGPGGPALIDWLACEAKAQNDGGRVKSGVKAASRGCFLDVKTASHVLARAVTLGLIEDWEERDGRFTCRISGWSSDQEKAQATARKANQRSRESSGHGLSEVGAPVAPADVRVRELFDVWRRECGHPTEQLTPVRRRNIEARLAEGFSPEEIRTAIAGAARNAFVNEHGTRFDDIELICRTALKLKGFIDRAGPPQARGSPGAPGGSEVARLHRKLNQADARLAHAANSEERSVERHGS